MWIRDCCLAVPTTVLLMLAACAPAITPDRVKQIKVCTTTYKEAKEILGAPDQIGQVGGHTTWRYNEALESNDDPPKLLLMFDNDRVVSDLAYNPPGLVELKSRCGKTK